MEIEIIKYDSNDQCENVYIQVDAYTVISTNSNLLLVRESTLTYSDDKDAIPQFEIYKVQFIASCKSIFENEILVAFYIGESHRLEGYVLFGLPERYSPSIDSISLLDYKSYLEMCDLTGETKLTFFDFYIKSKSLGINTLVVKDSKVLNFDLQQDLN